MLTVNPVPVLRLDSESAVECDKWWGTMYHRKYFCKHSANARQYVSGKRGVVVAGIGNVKGSAAPAAIGLQLWSGSNSTTLQRAHYEGAQAHRYFYSAR